MRIHKIILVAFLIVTIWNVTTEIGSILRTQKFLWKIEVQGAVCRPGKYYIEPGSCVLDAVEVAGGATEMANLYELNLDQPLKDKDVILVPEISW